MSQIIVEDNPEAGRSFVDLFFLERVGVVERRSIPDLKSSNGGEQSEWKGGG